MQETGLVEEMLLENMYRDPDGNFSIWDSVLYEKVKFEKNITLLLNRAVTYTFSEKTHINGFRLIVDSDLDREYTEGNPQCSQYFYYFFQTSGL